MHFERLRPTDGLCATPNVLSSITKHQQNNYSLKINMTLSNKVNHLVVHSRHVKLILSYRNVTPTKTGVVDKPHHMSRLYYYDVIPTKAKT
jgi:hypothetical protein